MKKVPSGIVPVIAIDRYAAKPLHRQIYEAFREGIVEGCLRTGQRVPSTRLLAAELGVSRIPALEAYAQLLAEGYFESRVGAGTIVSRQLPDQGPLFNRRQRGRPLSAPVGRRMASKRSSVLTGEKVMRPRGWGAFELGQVAIDHFPHQIWNTLTARHCRDDSARSLDYGNPLGHRDLREAIATYLGAARGVQCEADQIMIVNGSQQALEIAARVLLDPGDSVWMEEPGYRFARHVFKFAGSKIVPVSVDEEGLVVSRGIKRCRNARAALVTPSHQFPLGVTMSAARRLELLEWAERTGAWIIEDDYDSEFRYSGTPIASLQGLDRYSRVVYLGTLSKVLFPALRLGYVVIPPDLIQKFVAARLVLDIGPASLCQGVVLDFLREEHFSRHIRRMRSLYGERCRTLIDCIRDELGSGATITGAQAGLHISVILNGIRDVEVVERAARQRLWLVPLSSSYIAEPRQGFILGFGSADVGAIPKAVQRLRNSLSAAPQ
jgi:GntR family transcriptional regulator/MocR family aminotransferase